MAPKFDPADEETAKLIALFQAVGLTQAKAIDIAKNPKQAASFRDVIVNNDLTAQVIDEKRATLISGVATQRTKLGDPEKSYVINGILTGNLKSADQVSGKSVLANISAYVKTV